MIKTLQEKLLKIKELIFLEEGVDEHWDSDCNKSFLNFLDIVYDVLLHFLIIFGIISISLFITKVLL